MVYLLRSAISLPFFFGMIACHVWAMPLDLNYFTAEQWVTTDQNMGTVTFTEDEIYHRGYFYNDNFYVSDNITALTFDYSLSYGHDDSYDYFLFELNYCPVLEVLSPTSNHFEIDLTSYRDSIISLDWGLFWGGVDSAAGTIAVVSNINLLTENQTIPVPEPQTLIFVGFCMIIMACMKITWKNS